MATYKITHRKGHFVITLMSHKNGLRARVIDQTNTLLDILTGKDESDLYDNCRSWASSNIQGEFTIEPSGPKRRT